MRPKVKYAVIYRHREEYPVSVMCKFFGVSRSGYYDFVKRLGRPEQDAALAQKKSKRVKIRLRRPTVTDGCGNGFEIEISREIPKLCSEL